MYFLHFGIFVTLSFGASAAIIQCKLEWVQRDIELPDDIIPTSDRLGENPIYVSRVQPLSSSSFYGGWGQDGRSYYSESNTVWINGNDEILTNPHGCKTRWVDRSKSQNPELRVKIGPNGEYVGRALQSGRLLSGRVTSDGWLVYATDTTPYRDARFVAIV